MVPTFVNFEGGVLAIFDEEEGKELDSNSKALTELSEEQRTSSTTEEVTKEILKLLSHEK